MKQTRKNLIQEVLSDSGKELHVKDIAKELLKRNLESNIAENDLMTKVSNVLSTNIKKYKSKSIFRRVPNNKGGYKQGFYRLKKTRKPLVDAAIEKIEAGTKIETRSISPAYTGKAGEYAVLSELLFSEFNASLMSVDQGIDIVASKDAHFFHIQVKTANNRSGVFHSSVNKNQFNKFNASNTYYIFVLRYHLNAKIRSDFIVLRSFDIEKFVQTEVIQNGAGLNFNFKIQKGKIILNGKENVSFNFNNFSSIKS